MPTYYDRDGDVQAGDQGNGCEDHCILSNGGVEACGDNVDNDCDGETDEGFDFTVDPFNCGTCGTDCEELKPFGTNMTGCATGICQYE